MVRCYFVTLPNFCFTSCFYKLFIKIIVRFQRFSLHFINLYIFFKMFSNEVKYLSELSCFTIFNVVYLKIMLFIWFPAFFALNYVTFAYPTFNFVRFSFCFTYIGMEGSYVDFIIWNFRLENSSFSLQLVI